MFKTLQPLILASRSPRRRLLLRSVGIEFTIEPGIEDEPSLQIVSPAGAAEKQARHKASHVSSSFPNSWVLGADTIVVLDGQIFGKPSDNSEAGRMLRMLSGRVHEVITGMCLENAGKSISRLGSVSTKVRFKPLSSEQIESYIRTGEPMDKAGAYGIQGIGAFLVQSIEGSYTNVVGLPLCETVEWLEEEGIIAPG